jgi:transposase
MPKVVGDENTSPELRHTIVCLAQQNIPRTVIANSFNLHLRTVFSIIQRYKLRGHNEDLPRSGRPCKINERTSRQ